MNRRFLALLVLLSVLCGNLGESFKYGKSNIFNEYYLKTSIRLLKRFSRGANDAFSDHAVVSLQHFMQTTSRAEQVSKNFIPTQNSPCCGTNYCNIFSNYQHTQNWLSYNASCTFIQELLGQGGQIIVNQFLYSLDAIPNVVPSQKDTFLQSLMSAMSQQTSSNPSTSISHGTDHSVRVMGLSMQLHNAVIPSLSDLFGCSTSFENNTCLFLIMMTSLIHDTGYQDYLPELQEFVYAPSGSLLDNSLLLNNSQVGLDIIKNAGKSSVNISDTMLEAILLLPAKDQICASRDPQSHSPACLTNSTARMKQYGFGAVYWKPYTEHSMEKEPLHAFLRLVEALDITRDRLTSKQKNKDYIQYLYNLYTDQNLRQSGNDLTELANASYWIIENVEANWEGGNIGIYVKFLNLKGDCSETFLAPKYHSGPALFRINQLAVVAHSLYSDGDHLSDRITVELSQLIPGTNTTIFPLPAFSPRIIYDSNGNPSNLHICGNSTSCSLFLPLFNSPETCLEYEEGNVSVQNCQNLQHLGIPFSDLDYNSWLAVHCSESENQIPNSEPFWSFPLSVAIPGALGLGIVLMLGVYVYKKRKQRRDYETIADLDTPNRYTHIEDD